MKEGAAAAIEGTNLLAAQLIDWFQPGEQYVVAFSGGVDSAVVARAATLSVANTSIVTANSPAVSQVDLEDARRTALQIGVPHSVVETRELSNADYLANTPDRCFHCKSTLFETLAQHYGGATLVTGTNNDDLGDYRPGLMAAKQASVRSPLVELEIGKADVRKLAEYWGLSVADKPASPCLASRIAYGVSVTPERLGRIEAAECMLREFGLREFRVRLHENELARVEVHLGDVDAVLDRREQIVSRMKESGFRYVTLDLGGFESGSLNRVLPIEALRSK